MIQRYSERTDNSIRLTLISDPDRVSFLTRSRYAKWRCRRVGISNSHYTSFLSHCKAEGGPEAQVLNTALDKGLLKGNCLFPTDRGNNFIDTRELDHITTAEIVKGVQSSKVFVMLLTKTVLTRPWVLLEVYTALNAGIPVIPVKVFRQNPEDDYSFSTAQDFLSNLETNVYDETYMQANFGVPAWKADAWSPIQTTLTATRVQIEMMRSNSSKDIEHPDSHRLTRTISTENGKPLTLRNVQELCSAELPAFRSEEYKPNAHPGVIEAQVQVIVKRIENILDGSSNNTVAPPDPNETSRVGRSMALQYTRSIVSSISRTTSMTDAPEDDIERGDDSGAQVQVAEELNLSEQTPDSLPNDGPSPEFGHPSGL